MISIDISCFDNRYDTKPKPLMLSWPDFCARLAKHARRPDKDGPTFSPCRFVAGGTRKNHFVEHVTCAVLDLDHLLPGQIEGVLGRLAQYQWAAYTTHSNGTKTDEGLIEKWRIVLPLLAPVSKELWHELWPRLGGMISETDGACKDPARMFYWPSAPPGPDVPTPQARAKLEGVFLDLADLPDPVIARQIAEGRMSSEVAALIASNRHIRDLFEGRGKPEMAEGGRALDKTSSGYDYSLALALARKGVRDPGALGAALYYRPDGQAREKGERHISKTVHSALKWIEEIDKTKTVVSLNPMDDIDFSVEAVTILKSMPPIYLFTIDKQSLTISVEDLLNPKQFAARFLETLNRIPKMPGKRAPMSWRERVNGWLACATHVEQPPDSSAEFVLWETLMEMIDNKAEAGTVSDLNAGRVLFLDGGLRAFKTGPIRRALTEEYQNSAPDPARLCAALRAISCESRSIWLENKTVRVWVAPAQWPCLGVTAPQLEMTQVA